MKKYSDLLAEAKTNENRWRLIAMVLFLLLGISSVGIVSMSGKLIRAQERIEYVITPASQTITTVRAGQLPSHFVARAFHDAAGLLNAWSHATIEHNYQTLYDEYLSHELANRIRINVENNELITNAKKERLVSVWAPDYQTSRIEWCEKLKAPVGAQGLACGIVTGTQSIYADSVIPISETEVSYLLLGVNVAPNQFDSGKNLHGLEIIKIKKGPLGKLREELHQARREGKMPTDGGLYD